MPASTALPPLRRIASPGLGGERVGSDHHVLLRLDERLRGESAGRFRLLEGAELRRTEDEKQRERSDNR